MSVEAGNENLRGLTDGFQDRLVEGHLTLEEGLNDSHANYLGRFDVDIDIVGILTRRTTFLRIQIDHDADLGESIGRPGRS